MADFFRKRVRAPFSHFGELHRVARDKAGKTLGDVADHIGVSAAHLSDVDRGSREPLTYKQIESVATFLGCAVTPLYAAAEMDRRKESTHVR